jgi:Flp pilus assembly pilin Flp
MTLFDLVRVRLASQRGQTIAEYAILLGVIALVVLLAALLLGTSLSGIFSTTAGKV